MRPTGPSDLELDFRERDGFQIGKAAALADWQARKEEAGFKRLCHRLYARNWARKERSRNPERVRARLNRWRAENREKVRLLDRMRKARKRRQVILTCQWCGQKFRPKRFSTAKWCSRTCSNFYWTRHRKSRNRGIRNMQIEPTVFAVLRASPGLNLNELAARAVGVKRGSLATKLTEWIQKGLVVADGTWGGRGSNRGRRYRMAEIAAITSPPTPTSR
jgi:hypothetical protein